MRAFMPFKFIGATHSPRPPAARDAPQPGPKAKATREQPGRHEGTRARRPRRPAPHPQIMHCVALFYYTGGTTGLDPIFHLNYVAGCAGPPLFLKRLFQFSAYYYCAVRNRFQRPIGLCRGDLI